jgi:hypothetical protein
MKFIPLGPADALASVMGSAECRHCSRGVNSSYVPTLKTGSLIENAMVFARMRLLRKYHEIDFLISCPRRRHLRKY